MQLGILMVKVLLHYNVSNCHYLSHLHNIHSLNWMTLYTFLCIFN